MYQDIRKVVIEIEKTRDCLTGAELDHATKNTIYSQINSLEWRVSDLVDTFIEKLTGGKSD